MTFGGLRLPFRRPGSKRRRDRVRRVRWMTLLCVAAGCPTEVRKIGLRLDWSCPHRIKVRWHPQARQLVAVVTNVQAPAYERTVRVDAGLTAVAELAARLSGIAWLGWWARLPLFGGCGGRWTRPPRPWRSGRCGAPPSGDGRSCAAMRNGRHGCGPGRRGRRGFHGESRRLPTRVSARRSGAGSFIQGRPGGRSTRGDQATGASLPLDQEGWLMSVRDQMAARWPVVTGGPGEGLAQPRPVLRVEAEQDGDYRKLANTAALLGKGLEDLMAAARRVGAPDPTALDADWSGWSSVEAAGVMLEGWARLVFDALEKPKA